MLASSEEQLHQPVELLLEYEDAPVNVDPTQTLRFGWQVPADSRNSKQTAYRLVVGHSPDAIIGGDGDLWDLGVVESGEATNVRYDGPDLASDETYHWSVKVWTADGENEWADPAQFATALKPEDWHGDWIAHQPDEGDTNGWRSQ